MKLSIIMIEYHCMNHVKECVKSIDKYLQSVEKECFVISNSEYTKAVVNGFQKELSSVKIIDTQKNLGYAGGVNTGIKNASGDYIYVVNPDCLLTDAKVVQMMVEMEKDSDWAIAGPQVVDENNIIQPSCRCFPKPWTFLLVRSVLSKLPGADKERERYLMENFKRDTVKDVDWVSGGAALVKSSAIKKMGGMDERYFLYMEDVDWCHNCWLSGFTVKYDPQSVVMHAGQHQSIKGGIISKLMSKHVRMHLTSLFKYFMKYKFSFSRT